MAFDDDIALEAAADGSYHGAIADGWATPQGPLGGYVMAIVLNAMQLAVGDASRQPRSLTVHFLRPTRVGPLTVRPEIERTGRTLSSVTARVEQGGRLVALGIAAFSTAWESPLLHDAPIPDVEPPDPSRPQLRPGGGMPSPEFAQQLTLQTRFGDHAFSSSQQWEVGGWVGLARERPVDALLLAMLSDAWFPVPWMRLSEPAAAPTIDLTVHFRAPLPLDGLILARFNTRMIRDGFFDEDGSLWAQDGTLVAHSRQLGLLVRPKF